MDTRTRILLAEKSSFSQRGLLALTEIGPTDAFDLTQEQLVEAIADYNVLVVRLGLRVNEQVLEAGVRLQVVGTPTTGLDHIDLTAAERHRVIVLSLKGEHAFLDQVYATAEHTFALLFSLVRHVPFAFQAVKNYEWRRDLYRGRELNGKSLGVIGYGRLGRMVARYGAAFGMSILVYDPYQDELPENAEKCLDLTELLARSDVISVHVPLNDETRGLLSNMQFEHLRPGAVLINTSRGAVLDETALLRALESGRLAGAALDVLQDEHHIAKGCAHALIEYAQSHENLIITPHIGGATQESVEKADLFLANRIKQFLKRK